MSEREMIRAAGGGAGPRGEERVAGGRFARAHHLLLYFVGAVAVVWLLSGFYKVNVDEVAIVERLGQYISTDTGKAIEVGSGLHWHLPWPIDRVHVISVEQVLTMAVNAFDVSPAEYEEFKEMYLQGSRNRKEDQQWLDALFNPYLITADKSVLHMKATVLFQVSDPEQWLMAVSHDYHTTYDPAAKDDLRNQLFQQIAERAMIAQTSRMTFDQLLLGSRETLPGTVQSFVERGMKFDTRNPEDPKTSEEIDLGIKIKSVQVQLRPPDAVMGAYNNVLQQLATRDTKKSAAEQEANTMLTKAQGETKTLIVDAERYAITSLQEAQGEAARFSQVLAQYEQAPDVTRWNLYVDGATTVTAAAKRIISVERQEVWLGVEPPQYDANQVKTATRPGG